MNASEPDEPYHWTTLGRSAAYTGRMRIARHDVMLPSGARDTFEVDESVPFAVAVLVQEGGALLLAEQYRYAIDRWMLDLPGGAFEEGETPEQAARRECEEELGLIAEALTPLHTFYPNPGRTAWPVHLFVARSVERGVAKDDDETEQVRMVRLSTAELDARIASGDIVDPSLLIARMMAAVLGHLPPVGMRKASH